MDATKDRELFPEGFSKKTGFGGLIRLSTQLPLFLQALKQQAEKQSRN
jgi:hypothetical protein